MVVLGDAVIGGENLGVRPFPCAKMLHQHQGCLCPKAKWPFIVLEVDDYDLLILFYCNDVVGLLFQ